jgi:hypothetical protein
MKTKGINLYELGLLRVGPMALAAAIVAACGTQPPAASADIGTCGTDELHTGPLDAKHHLRLGTPALFDDGVGIESGTCFPLFNGDRLVTWLHAYHQFGVNRYVLQRCEETSAESVAPGSRNGAIAEEYDELTFDAAGHPVFAGLSAPSWSGFSNPAFCGAHVAYWGMTFDESRPARVDAILFDLATNRVVRREPLGAVDVESDSREYLQRPRWSSDARSVSFCSRTSGSAENGVGSRRLELGTRNEWTSDALADCP